MGVAVEIARRDSGRGVPTGAYGFALSLAEFGHQTSPDLVELEGSAPSVEVVTRHCASIVNREDVSDAGVNWARHGGSGFCASRSSRAITLDLPEPPTLEALVHPILTVPMSVLARWRGDLTLHAGAFEAQGAAWAVVGERQAGKSTLLAALAQRGLPVVADDLLTVLDGQVWAGPHCVDLRPDVAERYGSLARYVGDVGGRPRHRMSTPAGRPRLPLAGMFELAWHDEPGTKVVALAAKEVIELLFRQEYIALLGPTDARKVLDAGTVPAWRVSRKRTWNASGQTVERILEMVAGQR